MKKRTARRLALMRYERWLLRHHPDHLALPCVLRAYNRDVDRHNRRQWRALRGDT